MFDLEKEMDLEMLSDLFLEELEKIEDILEGIPGYEGIEEDEEGKEYEEVYGDGTKEELKEYQKKFKKYVERIKDGLEKIYRSTERKVDRKENLEPKMKSPWERGHKLGCGCPGCTAYRDFHGIKSNDNQNYQSSRIRPDLRLAKNADKSKKNKYNEETDSRPCGGKHYHMFHGNNAGMKSVLGNYTKRFNFRPMGY